jgi:hypothetical protein
MIPYFLIAEWRRAAAPWKLFHQVEQDLLISRIICEIYGDDLLREKVAIHGGTAINKLLYARSYRYSEDIDLVQVHPEGIGPVINRIQDILVPLFGKSSYERGKFSARLFFKFLPERSETEEPNPCKLKIEIATRERGGGQGYQLYPFSVRNG